MKRYLSLTGLQLTVLVLSVAFGLIAAPAAGLARNNADAGKVEPDPGRILEDLGIGLDAIQIKGWARIDDGDLGGLQIELLLGKILKSCSDAKIGNGADSDDIAVSLDIYTGFSPAGSGHGTFLTAEILVDKPAEVDYNHIHCTLVGLMKGLSSEYLVSALYIGALPGKLDESSIDKVCRQIFAACKGKIIEGVRGEGFISLTGWSDLIEGGSLSADGRKINLNLALRYSDYDKATRVWLGTPIIFTGY